LLLGIAAPAGAPSQHSFRRTSPAATGDIGLIIVDTAMITAVMLAAPAFTWDLAIAITASLTRARLAARLVPHASLAESHARPGGTPPWTAAGRTYQLRGIKLGSGEMPSDDWGNAGMRRRLAGPTECPQSGCE
jgi:hypothetical protein